MINIKKKRRHNKIHFSAIYINNNERLKEGWKKKKKRELKV